MKPDLSLALGSYEVEPIELAGAYATFAAGGEYEEPRLDHAHRRPRRQGRPAPAAAPAAPRARRRRGVRHRPTCSRASSITAPAQRAKELGRPLAGKTGTSNLSKDTWFAGYSTDIAAVVWVGYDDGKPLGASEQGAVTALPAWVSFMKVACEHKPASEFPRPAGRARRWRSTRKTGKLPYPGDTETLNEVFLAGTEPTEVGNPYLEADGGERGPYDDDGASAPGAGRSTP